MPPPGPKLHWVSSKYFAASLFKALDIHYSIEAEESNATVFSTFTPGSSLVHMADPPLRQSFAALPKYQPTLRTLVSQRTRRMKALIIAVQIKIETCNLPSLQCFDSYEEFCCTAYFFLSQVYCTSCLAKNL